MSVYGYKSNMPGVSDTILGTVFSGKTLTTYSSDQPQFNAYVPGRLDRFVDGVLSNTDLVLPRTISAQEKANASNSLNSGKVDYVVPVHVGTWAARPSAVTAGIGKSMLVTDYGYIEYKSDGTNWKLPHNSTIVDNNTTTAGLVSNTEQIIKAVPLAAGILTSMRGFIISFLVSKNDTLNAVSSVVLRLGTSGTLADPTIYSTAAWAAGSFQFNGGRAYRAINNTSLQPMTAGNNQSLEDYGVSTMAYPVSYTVPDMSTSNMYLTLAVTCAGTTETPLGQRITIMGW